jgi:hypothetical protein
MIRRVYFQQKYTHLIYLPNQAAAVPRPGFNGGPALLARKPVMLLVCHFLQHVFGFLTLAALVCAHLIVIVIVSHCGLNAFMQVVYKLILYFFFEK